MVGIELGIVVGVGIELGIVIGVEVEEAEHRGIQAGAVEEGLGRS